MSSYRVNTQSFSRHRMGKLAGAVSLVLILANPIPCVRAAQSLNLNFGTALCPGAASPVSLITDSAGNTVELDCNGGFNLYYVGVGKTKCHIGTCRYAVGENAAQVTLDAGGRLQKIKCWNFEGHNGHDPALPVADFVDVGYENRDTYIYHPPINTLEIYRERRLLTQSSCARGYGYSDPGNRWLPNSISGPARTVLVDYCGPIPPTIPHPSVTTNAPHVAALQFRGRVQGGGQVRVTINGVVVTVLTDPTTTLCDLARGLIDAFNQRWGSAPLSQQGKVAALAPGYCQIVHLTGAVEEEIEVEILDEPDLRYNFCPFLDGDTVCPRELVGVDIGGALPPGSVFSSDREHYVSAGGAGIEGTMDQFHYAYAEDSGSPGPMHVCGDFTAVVAVASMDPSALPGDDWAKAGIMAREDLGPRSAHVMAGLALRAGAALEGRDVANDPSWRELLRDFEPFDANSPSPVWLRLDRVGNTFTGSYALGGETAPTVWSAAVSREVPLPPVLVLGLATTPHKQAEEIQVTYSDFCFGPNTGPPVLIQPELPDSPVGGDGYVSIREVIDNGPIPDQDACYASLASGTGVIVDYTAGVLNLHDSGGNGHYDNDDAFGVVQQGHRNRGAVDHLSLLARGAVRIPAGEGGPYTFGVCSGDGFTLQFPGHDFASAVNGEIVNFEDGAALRFHGGRPVRDTLGVIELPPGDHPFRLTYHETDGHASVELYAARGIFPTAAQFDASQFKLVGFGGSGGIPVPGLCAPVVMEASKPGGQVTNLRQASDALSWGGFIGTNSSGSYPWVNHSDPDDGANDPDWSGLQHGDLSFPNNEPGNDEDFGLQVTGQLEIPAAGWYQFAFNSDDGAMLQIPGIPWDSSIVADATGSAFINNDELVNDSLATWSFTAGEIHFPQSGCFNFTALMFERDGGSFFELFGRGLSPTTGQPDPAWHLLKVGGAKATYDPDGLPLVP